MPWPYGYYQLLRLIVAATAVALILYFHRGGRRSYAAVTVLAALVFNPLVPLSFDKGTWSVLNLIFGVWFLFCFKVCRSTGAAQ